MFWHLNYASNYLLGRVYPCHFVAYYHLRRRFAQCNDEINALAQSTCRGSVFWRTRQ